MISPRKVVTILKNLSRLLPKQRYELPLIPLKDMVVFPHNVSPFTVSTPSSKNALEAAMSGGSDVFVAFQKTPAEEPSCDDLHSIGTIARIIQVLKSQGMCKVLVEGHRRAQLRRVHIRKDAPWGQFSNIEEASDEELRPLCQIVKENFLVYSKICNKSIPGELLANIMRTDSPDKLIGQLCAALDINAPNLIPFLQEIDNRKRLSDMAVTIKLENEAIELRNGLRRRVKTRMERTQKEYILNEQLKEIHKELGSDEADPTGSRGIERKVLNLELPDEVNSKVMEDVKRLARLPPMSPESGILRTYLEWIVELPWGKRTKDEHDIGEAACVLAADHFGLEKPKERILDFIAVRQLSPRAKSPILCFVGPPGTGKTSLGRSVARALGRNFARISLGGVRDEAEIRGHRKTYVGALPGKIIQAQKRAGSVNPVFLLDEIDKMSNDYRGDPASALLEVLDPEQNNSFTDHYLEVPFDLSEVIFITTANSLEAIPYPLRDRMEVIRTPGYTMEEKKSIAWQFIIPKQINENGLQDADVSFREESLNLLIRGYTQEAGVRNMERAISQVIRKVTRKLLQDEQTRPGRWVVNSAALHLNQEISSVCRTPKSALPPIKGCHLDIDPQMVRDYLGIERLEDHLGIAGRAGVVPGLYYDGSGGGGVLPVEVLIFDGEETLFLTGKLGDVIKESAMIALSYLRANKHRFGLKSEFDKNKSIHIHIPQGAIPVDGPSAGIALTAALLSAALQAPVRPGITVTGEITLTGRILPIGGVKEKALAARRRGYTALIMPKDNKRDADELPQEVREKMDFIFHECLSDALLDLFPEGVLIPLDTPRTISHNDIEQEAFI